MKREKKPQEAQEAQGFELLVLLVVPSFFLFDFFVDLHGSTIH